MGPVRPARGCVGYQSQQACVGGGKVVQSAGGEELALGPEHRRCLRVRHNDVVTADVRGINSGAFDTIGKQSQKVLAGRISLAEDGVHVLLLGQVEPVVIDAAVQVNGQLRKTKQRTGGGQVLQCRHA